MSRRKPTNVDDEVPSQASQKITTQLRGLINDCVYYLLIANQKKYPIKRIDIVKNVLKEHGREFKDVISAAKLVLKDVFGFDLVELDSKKGQYIIINLLTIPPENYEIFCSQSEIEAGRKGLLFTILSHIFMNENVSHEKLMWRFLKKLGLDHEDPKPHPLFGDVKKLMTQEFVKQGYLDYTRIDGREPPEHEFRAGPRALLEVSKYDLLQFFCHVYGEDTKIEDWPAHLQDANEEKNH